MTPYINPKSNRPSSLAFNELGQDDKTEFDLQRFSCMTEASISLTNQAGDSVGYADSLVFNTNVDAFPIIPPTASFHPPIGYYVPSDDYTVRMHNFSDTLIFFSMSKDLTTYFYTRSGAQIDQTDIFQTKKGISFQNPDDQAKLINLEMILNNDVSEKVYVIDSCSIEQNDEIEIESFASDELRIVNNGRDKTYNLRISYASDITSREFNKNKIHLPANTTQLICPNWDLLDETPPLIMDGQLDSSAVLIASSYKGAMRPSMDLYAWIKGSQLYVATNFEQREPKTDNFIFISAAPGLLYNTPWGNTGQVSRWHAFLGKKSTDNTSGWFDSTGTALSNYPMSISGSVLEGIIDIDSLFGERPDTLLIAGGKYQPTDGGRLWAQAPCGDGNLDIESWEFCKLGTAPAYSPWKQLGKKIKGISWGTSFGSSIAISGDGNTMIVGGQGSYMYKFPGGAWIFTRDGELWQQQQKLEYAETADGELVTAVAISTDGNTAIVGSAHENDRLGAAWVFARNGDVWRQQGSKLVCTGAEGYLSLGSSVALSSDGNTAIVGGSVRGSGSWVFTRTADVWTQQGGKLVGGSDVALSSDGNTAIIGWEWDDDGQGSAMIYTRSGGVWTQQGGKLIGSGAVGKSHQGLNVDLSADGNTAIIGGPYDEDPSECGKQHIMGAAWVFTRENGAWSQQGSKLVGKGAVGLDVQQGNNVALSADGNTAILGGKGDANYVGAAWLFTRSNGVWNQEGSKLFGTGANYGALQGSSVDISSDGKMLVVGGIGSAGAVWVYVKTDTLSQVYESSTTMNLSYSLNQNYPNPFNPTTTIAFSLPTSSFVQLKVFNILGEKVKTLVEEKYLPGMYNVAWDGTDDKSNQVGAGIYLYQIKTANFIRSKKMLLLK